MDPIEEIGRQVNKWERKATLSADSLDLTDAAEAE